MRIVACVAAVPNPEKVKWDRFRQLLDLQEAEPVLNPADKNALELAAALAKQAGATFDAICAGPGASAALREAAVFGADGLVALEGEALESADEAGVAAALSAAIKHRGGADVIFCGPSTTAHGTGAVPGILSALLKTSTRVDVLGVEHAGETLRLTTLCDAQVCRITAAPPLVVVAAPYGIKVRTVSPLLLMKAAKRVPTLLSLDEIGCPLPLPTTGAVDGPLESARGRHIGEIIDGPDAASRAISLVAALREKQAI